MSDKTQLLEEGYKPDGSATVPPQTQPTEEVGTTDADEAVPSQTQSTEEDSASTDPQTQQLAPQPLHELPARLEMKVDHVVATIQLHKLKGQCPKCGKEIETDNRAGIEAFEKGQTTNSHCSCGARLTVLGRSRIVTADRVVVPGRANNRHARRTKAATVAPKDPKA